MALEGLDGVVCVADDILVYGVGDKEQQATLDHDEKLRKLMTRCSERGIRLNNEKTEMRKNEIRYLGHRISKDGLKPDPDKVKAIVNMKPPSDVAEIQRLAGMVNYLAKFLRGLSDAMKPIRYLTNKDVEWEWGKKQDDAFKKVKKLVAEATVRTIILRPREVTSDTMRCKQDRAWYCANARRQTDSVCKPSTDADGMSICSAGERDVGNNILADQISSVHIRATHAYNQRPQTTPSYCEKAA